MKSILMLPFLKSEHFSSGASDFHFCVYKMQKEANFLKSKLKKKHFSVFTEQNRMEQNTT